MTRNWLIDKKTIAGFALALAKLTELQQTIALRSKSLEAALQVVNTNQGQQLIQKIRKLSDRYPIAENQLLQS